MGETRFLSVAVSSVAVPCASVTSCSPTTLPQAPKTALQTAFRGGKLQTIAQHVLQLSADGLQRRGLGEEKYLEPLQDIAHSGVTRAERILALYSGAWKGSLDPLFDGDFDF